MTKFRIGRHIDVTTGFKTAPAFAEQIHCQIMQIFLGNPHQVLSKSKSKADLLVFKSELKSHKMKVVIHGHYTINFCHESDSSRFRTSVKALVSDLKSSHIIGSRSIGVIIHMGKNVSEPKISDSKAISNYILGLQTALDLTSDLGVPIILETGAGVGSEVGTQLEQLAQIYDGIGPKYRPRIKFCIDTCHIWAAGYDISNRQKVQIFFKLFDKLIGMNKISCFHFNNSQTELGSKKDRHADLVSGLINSEGLETIAQFASEHQIPIIMETPLNTINPKTNADITFDDELALVKKWIKN